MTLETRAQISRELRSYVRLGFVDTKTPVIESNIVLATTGDRATSHGLIDAYIHPGQVIGVIVEVRCESDSLSSTDDFHRFTKYICLQIAAANPSFISRWDIPDCLLIREIDIALDKFQDRTPRDAYRLVGATLERFFAAVCLYEQPFIREPAKTVWQFLTEKMRKAGEVIRIARFARFQLGAPVPGGSITD
jgi:elongation factor Ts